MRDLIFTFYALRFTQINRLQILTFLESSSMVRRVAGGLEGLKVPAGCCSGVPNVLKKIFGCDMRRAGAGNENSTVLKMPDRGASEPLIGVKCTGAVRLALGERRRVKDDQIKLALLILTQPFKRIGLDQLMPAGSNRGNREVQSKIPASRSQGMVADIQDGHAAGATARRVHRKSAGEAERIKRFASSCEDFDVTSVLTLVEEKAGFLSAQHVG